MTEGVKYDQGKERFDLIPTEAMFAWGQCLTYGAHKYGDRNWEKGMGWGRIFAATLRHLFKWWAGQDLDSESGLPHLYHAFTNLSFLITYTQRRLGEDDRPFKGRTDKLEG